jgi:metallo-beta-lactamase class B
MKHLFLGIIFLFNFNLLGQIGVLEITHLTGNFYIYTTYKDLKGKPFPANGMYLITDSGAVIIDTPWDTSQFQPLLDSIELKHHTKAILCISTHSHEDRTAGLNYYKSQGIKTFTSYETFKLCKLNKEKSSEFYFVSDTTFTLGAYNFETFYPGAGHTNDNIVLGFPSDGIIYGGCFVKSTEAIDLGFVGDANISAWAASMIKLKNKFPKPQFVIPGHQCWENTNSLDHTLNLIDQHSK